MKATGLPAVAVGVVAIAALGACGRSASVSISTGAGPLASIRSDRAAAERVVLNPADLPGYEIAPGAAADATSVQAASTFEACAGAAAASTDEARTAQSPGFFRGQSVAVSSLAVVSATEADARAAIGDLSRADLAGCLTALFRTVLGLDLLPGTRAATELIPTATVTDQAITWRTTIQLTSGSQTVAAYSDLTFFRSGRTVASLFDFGLGEPFPEAERTGLLSAMAGRASGI